MATYLNDVAIIGMACRFPGASNYEQYWRNLISGISSVQEIPATRWRWEDYQGNPLTEKNKSNSKWGGFIDDVDRFDPGFFGLSGKEVEAMDPQQRIMLELSWACFEDAGINVARHSGAKIGIYTGVFNFDYKEIQEKGNNNSIEAHHSTGTAAAIIPNRLSYYYNFSGPSVPVDTACSSSLHAIHLAIQSLQQGECTMALAGGINLILTPTRHISFSKTGMLSPTGSCKTFDESADGYVRSEGAGFLLLKPLTKALEDGDTVYAVLKGSAVNHGGKNYTLTYPNPDAQAAVIRDAIKKAGIGAETLTYIEAHGTGTPKGDPIEFKGLHKAFESVSGNGATALKPFCGVGSVKANIGHLESAAGVAGVIKVVLAMRYGQLPGLHHFKKLNPRISIEDSPFYIVDKLQEWERIVTADGKMLPRRAGVSSFGFGGTNAHVILEEAPVLPLSPGAATDFPLYLICLSAKTDQALKRKVTELLQWLEVPGGGVSIKDISATLLAGREHFDIRIAILAAGIEQLKSVLETISEGKSSPEYYRRKADIKDLLSPVLMEEISRNIVRELSADSSISKESYIQKIKILAELYTHGNTPDLNSLFVGHDISRIALPTYPFEKEHYWTGEEEVESSTAEKESLRFSWLHPLLHRNTSDFSMQQYTAVFNGDEFFFKDHVVSGLKILPAVGCLEMVRAAVENATASQRQDRSTIVLKNVVWERPVIVQDEPLEVNVSLIPVAADEITYEIYATPATATDKIIYSEGSISTLPALASPVINLEERSQVCNNLRYTAEECYDVFSKMGFTYGPGHRLLDHVMLGDDQVLGKISLTAAMNNSLQQYVLHPGLMDAALQAALILAGRQRGGTDAAPQLLLPFALKQITIYKACTAGMRVWVRYSHGERKNEKIHHLDIDICDEAGTVCVAMKEVAFRAGKITADHAIGGADAIFTPRWLPAADIGQQLPELPGKHIILLCELENVPVRELEDMLGGAVCRQLESDQQHLGTAYTDYCMAALEAIKNMLLEKSNRNILVQIVVGTNGDTSVFAGLSGLLKTAQQEYPSLKGQLIMVPAVISAAVLAIQLKESMRLPSQDIRFLGNQPEVLSWEELPATDETIVPWKPEGVYLITGGIGGVGLIFAKEMLRVCKGVKLVLNGRSALSRDKQRELEALQLSGDVAYMQADISKEEDCRHLMEQIQSLYGRLTGILHGAGVLRDSFIIKKSTAELQDVFSAKVTGLINLDSCSRQMNLDFFVLFSSVSGVFGNTGQADYAMANVFMDRYAEYRNDLVKKGVCQGKTIAVNWPLWQRGGMQVDNATLQWMKNKTGMVPIAADTGIRALYKIIASGKSQALVLKGDIDKIKTILIPGRPAKSVSQKILQAYLVKTVAVLLSVPATEIDVDAEFIEYGLDRVAMVAVTDQLNKTFQLKLTGKSLLDLLTLREVVQYLLEQMDNDFIDQLDRFAAGEPINETPIPAEEQLVSFTEDQLQEKTEQYLMKFLSRVLKVPTSKMEAGAPMEKYGIDSVMVIQLTNQLEDVFGPLSRTLFFEYQHIKSLAGYFIENHHKQLLALLGQHKSVQQEHPQKQITNVAHPAATVKPLKNRLIPIAVPEQKLNQYLVPEPESDIAIVGLGGRYPQAADIAAFWDNLKAGKDCITEVPKERWDHSLYYDADKNKPGKAYSKWGGFIDGVDLFDPLFFNISPREAERMDPQERIFLECVMATLEDAGYTRETLAANRNNGLEGNVGVFVGVMYEEYQLYGLQAGQEGLSPALWGIASSIANRVSYYCNFHGPSLAVDTMCSSSLTAIHLACQSIIRGDCELAIAGGVNVSVHPNKYIFLSQGRFVSSIGRCESFGEGGDGYVPGEGVGAVLLKPLSKAIADGDHIYGVIKGSAVNHGGKTNGYSVPNPGAQSGVISHAFKKSGVDPRSISYIEAHGTGTFLGDPIEIAGLNKAFREFTSDKQFCAIGSAKSNIGHCESAAGIAGLTKILLQLKHRQLVPSLHSAVLNVNIDFANSPFVVQQELSPWERPLLEKNGRMEECPLRAGISSFGAGGSNAHLVIEEYRVTSSSPASTAGPYMLVLSARTGERLKAYAERLLHYFTSPAGESLQDIAYTLQTGREDMEERMGMLVHTREEATDKLQRYIAGEEDIEDLYTGQVKKDKESLWLLTDEDFHQGVVSWIRKGKYGKLLELWTKGYHLDWHLLYPSGMAKKVSLPTYPFARERYWFSKKETTVAAPVIAATGELRFLTKSWQPLSVRSQRARKGRIQILVTAATRSLGAAVAAQLVNSDVIGIEDIGRWDATSEGLIDLTGCEAQAMPGLHWLPVIQQFIEEKSREGIRLLGVTFDLERYGNKKVQVSGALHGGLYRMLGAEYRQVSSCHLDVLSEVPVSVVAEQIAAAYLFAGGHTEISVREGQYYTSVLTEQTLKSKAEKSIVFGENEVLWITGGTRGIGYLCAEHFVRHYGVRRLVLSGREVLPAREEWARVIAANGAQASKLKGIQHLESLGATVEILTVDITDAAAVSAQVTAVKTRHGRIVGVIHAAGVIDAETPAFIRKTQAGINAVLSAKVKGLEVLYGCLREEPLQFFVMYSSVSSQIPVLGAGQSDYTMGNAYMDYFAQGHQEGFPVLSIQWPSWKETGMGEIKNNVYAQTGLLSLSNDAGLSLLDDILADGSHPVIMPAIVNVSQWSPGSLLEVATVKPQIREAAATAVAVKNTTVVKTDQITPTIDWLTEIFTRELKIEKSRFEISRSFPDYGVDSVLLSQILGQINKQLGEQLDPSVLMEYSSVEELSRWLEKKYSASLSALLTTPEPVAMEQLAEAPVVSLPAAAISVASMQPLQELAEAPVESLPAAVSVASVQPLQEEAIAVVGLSCRFPGADNLAAYWRLLSEGRSAISGVPYERWGYKSDHVAGLIDKMGYFDGAYFMISPEDARAMDPQALLLLEESLFAWHHAGYTLADIKGKPIGVYIGGRSQHRPSDELLQEAQNPIMAVGPNYLATNISRFFDLRGPALVVDTACSSALVGMNLAVQALQSGEIEAALVGGVGLLDTDNAHRIFAQRNLLSSDGHFHIFDQRAGGVVLGEGAGTVILKRVSQAVKDGDEIYAVIKGIAINNDGRTAGPATPNIQGQKEVMSRALLRSGIAASDISYIEANGSGSEVTDLLELKAISAVYGGTAACGLGSMKPNIGHPLCAEGIAGFIKVVLMLMHQQQAPFLSGQQGLAHYDLSATPFYFNRELQDWKGNIAALNCFADGGTNAHVIIAAADEQLLTGHIKRRTPLPVPILHRNDTCSGVDHTKVKDIPEVATENIISIWKSKILQA
ncbi:SDR family NAD(P)-dependent oxidoreductase [Chitinophaga sancti]|uniref:SDR family NAD(P)-dependent oxidoreductase n=1 Tax=Chitinophaga sancti TaxID=1004 RepID=UPI002A74E8FA|nr:SDR family NAD(P)-dependent oxidoreductase [Chitinophaga sancti]WPQ61784.1 SDR family NAD(P)-dependent oxidoreductase [Chitinophaga sancti]